ncbi:30S ribosomal protein S12 methylthiotransferase RimO [Desulfatiferula olefinivorans]
MKTVYLESLGCARNLVDSEHMLGRLVNEQWVLVDDPAAARLIVVNTCSFIASAADESIDTILALAEYKKTGQCERLVVTGCLPQRYGRDIVLALPEVDLFLGTGAVPEITEYIRRLADFPDETCVLPDPNALSPDKSALARVPSSTHTAYLKIAEGCSRHCTYCIIPRLRGRYRSRSREDILCEARDLIGRGIREINLVAESTTDYGRDLDPRVSLAAVLEGLNALPGDFRIRLLYAYPDTLDDDVIRAVARLDKVCPYFDVPVQHAADPILKAMGRGYSRRDLLDLFARIRRLCPQAALRTTLITGFPGERVQDFNALLSFINEVRFDHLGVFTYSDAEDLPSHGLDAKVTEKTARKRADRIMEAQARVSLSVNQDHLGRVCRVLIEEAPEPGLYLGRTEFQAPEVDGMTFVYADDLRIGDMVWVTITDAHEYDLSGECHVD